MNISIKSIAILLAAGFPCAAFADTLGFHLPAALTSEAALGCYIALLAGLTMLSDYTRTPRTSSAVRYVARPVNAACERHRLAA